MDAIIELIKSLAWPGVVLAVAFGFRRSIRDLLRRAINVKYGKLDVSFEARISRIEEAVPTDSDGQEAKKTESKIREQVQGLTPSYVIIEAWGILSQHARGKVDQLAPPEDRSQLLKDDPVMYLAYSGALGPSLSNALGGLKAVIDDVRHGDRIALSDGQIDRYLALVSALTTAIDSISNLPSARLTALTYLILEINALIDTGRCDSVSVNDVKNAIKEKDVFGFLKRLSPEHIDLSLVGSDGPYPGFPEFYHAQLSDILQNYGGRERRKWGIEHRGLCLLIAWTNEIIQRGHGWFPGG